MSIPKPDQILIDLAQYLMYGLNALVADTDIVVVKGLSVNAADQYRNFPLLGVYRRVSRGDRLEECEIEIIYYASALNEAIYFRWLEQRIIELLQNFLYGKANCLKLVGGFTSRQGVVRTHDNLMLAQLRIVCTIIDTHTL